MNKFRQQLILLFALMGFLSAVTVFFVTVTSSDPGQEAVDNSQNNESVLQSIEVTEPEGDGLIAQSIKGLIALNEDFNTGLSAISGEVNETEENKSLDSDIE
ncbi:MAG: hypothetical protein R6V35_04800 [Candidatus Nanohaloarchaea archaeon]